MNCIDKERSIKEDIASIENRVRHAFNQGYDFGFKDGKGKAKSQEPVLDKIKAEIAEIQLIGYAMVDGKREIASRAVMQIIDKYKKESEDKNAK